MFQENLTGIGKAVNLDAKSAPKPFGTPVNDVLNIVSQARQTTTGKEGRNFVAFAEKQLRVQLRADFA